MIGQLLDGRYRIVAVASQGEIERTYLAKDTKRPGNPTCLIKELHSEEARIFPEGRVRFEQEAEILAILGKHPQIPELLAYFQENESLYQVREHFAGVSLAQELLVGQPLCEEEAIDIVVDLLEILQYIHVHGWIYRDLKPQNIIRREEDNKLVLIDFRAIAPVDADPSHPTMAIGTLGYVPSEQINGESQLSSDIYAVGIIGIQALTGINPEPRDRGGLTLDARSEIIWRHQALLSEGLALVLTKMVRYNCRERYQSAEEALQAILHRNEYTDYTPPSGDEPTEEPSLPSQRWITINLSIFGIAAGIFMVILFKWLIDNW